MSVKKCIIENFDRDHNGQFCEVIYAAKLKGNER